MKRRTIYILVASICALIAGLAFWIFRTKKNINALHFSLAGINLSEKDKTRIEKIKEDFGGLDFDEPTDILRALPTIRDALGDMQINLVLSVINPTGQTFTVHNAFAEVKSNNGETLARFEEAFAAPIAIKNDRTTKIDIPIRLKVFNTLKMIGETDFMLQVLRAIFEGGNFEAGKYFRVQGYLRTRFFSANFTA